MKFIFRILILQILLSFSSHAQGTAFTYQGRLSDGTNPAGGIYDLRFAIYDLPGGGTLQGGAVTNLATPVTNGLFTVTLDFGAAVFTGADRWLEIAVRTNGGGSFATLAPRQPVTATPYAIYAKGVNATGISGTISAANVVGTYGNVVSFTNAGNRFTGNGAGLTNVNAVTLGGLNSSDFWRTSGNADITAGTQFLGTTDTNALEFKVNGKRLLRLEPHFSGGDSGSIIGGNISNRIEMPTGGAAIVGGGFTGGPNIIRTNSNGSFIGAGSANEAGPGVNDVVIGGGFGNKVQATGGAIAGGQGNTISPGANYATLVGGYANSVRGSYSSIGGGLGNTTQSNSLYVTVGGGAYNSVGTNSNTGTISGGYAHTISDNSFDGTIGGGSFNSIGTNSYGGTIAGGGNNVVGSNVNWSTIGGGYQNTNSRGYATVAGGYQNMASGDYATVPGGFANIASGFSSVAMGDFSRASGFDSVAIGRETTASGSFSTAMGRQARAIHQGSFVWADNQTIDFFSTATNQFSIRAVGGVRIVGPTAMQGNLQVTGGDGTQLILQNSVGSQSWSVYDESFNGLNNLIFQPNTGVGAYIRRSDGNYIVNSDERLKRDIVTLNGVLARVMQLRPVSYQFRSEPESAPHTFGFIAQEVERLFPEVVAEHSGMKGLAYSSLVPVAVGAIQELNQKLEEKEQRIQELEKAVRELKEYVTKAASSK